MCKVLTNLSGCYWNWRFLLVLLCLCQETRVKVSVKFPVDLYLECKFTLSQKRGIAYTWTRVSFIECTDSRKYSTSLRAYVLQCCLTYQRIVTETILEVMMTPKWKKTCMVGQSVWNVYVHWVAGLNFIPNISLNNNY